MDYYRTLHLDREPFSNSPDPGLFFNSKQHLEALQKLEISIRLKRGLNVITGDVGTGKTTISRQLIQKISHDPGLNYFLILDPGFSSTTDFLHCILNLFTGETLADLDDISPDDTAIKERIKTCLFARGVDQAITTILIIDEGQKLPVFCLEVLRELLNYETNDHKLLQIIIFAQMEFVDTIHALDNFNDRINFRYTLYPLGFSETRQLIRFRLEKSGSHTAPAAFFSFFAYLTLFWYTKGYPRKIINLCHHILIRMIIKNLSRASGFFVASCAREVFAHPRPRRFSFVTMAIVLLLLSGGVVLLNGSQISHLVSGTKNQAPKQASATDVSQINKQVPPAAEKAIADLTNVTAAQKDPSPPAETVSDRNTSASDGPLKPPLLGTIQVPRNETLSNMVALVYGTSKKAYVRELLQANPKIKNPDHITAGMGIDFPVIDTADQGWEKDKACICLARETTFAKAFAAARRLQKPGLDIKILHGWHHDTGFSYAVVVNRIFDTPALAAAYRDTQTDLVEKGICETVSVCTTNEP